MNQKPLEYVFCAFEERTLKVSEYVTIYFDNISDEYYSSVIDKNHVWLTCQLTSINALIEITNPVLEDDLYWLKSCRDALNEMIAT